MVCYESNILYGVRHLHVLGSAVEARVLPYYISSLPIKTTFTVNLVNPGCMRGRVVWIGEVIIKKC
jgi:hypothetical protein